MGRLTLPSIASAVRSSIPAATILSIVSSASCYQKHHASAFVTNSPCPRYQVSTTALSASWKPCAQPRFDEFANCIVGPWNLPAADDDAQPKKEEVEEVMRSCGGAIQGIRDLPLSNIFPEAGEEDRTYHNRADGGFVYFDDGSYSAGPEQWDWNNNDAASEKLLMASISFPNMRRVWLTSKSSEASEVLCNKKEDGSQLHTKVMELSRPWSKNEVDSDSAETDHTKIPNINWKSIKRIRMPSSNQPWSLARSKCEKQVIDESEEGADSTSNMGPLIGWSIVESIAKDQKDLAFGDILDSDATIIRMMAVCPVSGVASSVARCYDEKGLLKSVAFLDGSYMAN